MRQILSICQDRSQIQIYLLSALKIHVSSSTKEILDKYGTFVTELRGQVKMKVGLFIPPNRFCLYA